MRETVVIRPTSATLGAGVTRWLVATDSAGAQLSNTAVQWTSSDVSVASVGPDGLARGWRPGTVTMTAQRGSAHAFATLAVEPLVLAQISPGGIHTCALTQHGEPLCWGAGDGRLGDSSTAPRYVPARVATPLTFAMVAAGDGSHSCGLVAGSGAAYCWGIDGMDNVINPGPDNTGSIPAAVPGGLQFKTIAVGYWHACGLTADGAAYCWGRNDYGQLGVESTGETCNTAHLPCSHMPVRVAGGLSFTSITAGGAHSCALTADGTAYCWGYNGTGELGTGTTDPSAANATPQPVQGGLHFAAISAGAQHTCGLNTTGTAYCWGAGESGQLGVSFGAICPSSGCTSTTPVAVSGGLTFSTIQAGLGFTCALTADGSAYCWGMNDVGQLGDGTATSRATPAAVSGGLHFITMSAKWHGCGTTNDGSAYCWGRNDYGQLGDDHITSDPHEIFSVPRRVGGTPP
ncbi:MAG TPA: Ig-like domain-containing protein [Gemmatimonadaceae bacterium]|nr:Ig-like domain-containing protein [Gemmatimonadaceae bacterium]